MKRWLLNTALLCTFAWSVPLAVGQDGASVKTSDTQAPKTAVHTPTTLAGKVIVIDPGHGGPDSGARSADGTYEKTVALDIGLRLVALLQQAGAIVSMTRSTDTDLATEEDRAQRRRHQGDLRNRVRFIKAHHPDMVISIHCNAVNSPAWSGASTIYMNGNEEGKRLASLIQSEFKANLLPTKRSIDDMDSLYVLRRVEGPVALAEVGFLSNPTEASHLVQPSYQSRIALALYVAAWRYFTDPPSPA